MAAWSPLAYFREQPLLPRVIFTIGGVLFLSLPFVRNLALSLLSVGVIFVAVGLNFFLKLVHKQSEYPYRWILFGQPALQAVIAFSIAATCLYLAWYRYYFGVLPALLRTK
jgi:hypothetical protein